MVDSIHDGRGVAAVFQKLAVPRVVVGILRRVDWVICRMKSA